jgi:hypothetical protein
VKVKLAELCTEWRGVAAAGIGTDDRVAGAATIAMVPNSQMTDARELSSRFDAENPTANLGSSLPENPGPGNDHQHPPR